MVRRTGPSANDFVFTFKGPVRANACRARTLSVASLWRDCVCISSSGAFVPGNKCDHSPSSLRCMGGGSDVSVLTQSRSMAGSLTDNVCTPPPYEGSFLSLASWFPCRRNPWTLASCIVRSADRGPVRTSTGSIVGRTAQACSLEEGWHSSPLSQPCDRTKR